MHLYQRDVPSEYISRFVTKINIVFQSWLALIFSSHCEYFSEQASDLITTVYHILIPINILFSTRDGSEDGCWETPSKNDLYINSEKTVNVLYVTVKCDLVKPFIFTGPGSRKIRKLMGK